MLNLLAAGSLLAQSVEIPNIGGTKLPTSLATVIVNAVNYGLLIAGSVAVLMIIVGGFLYITASGDQERLEKAKKTLRNAIIGVIIILLSLAIVNTINFAIT